MSEKEYRVNEEGSIVPYDDLPDDDQVVYQRPDITEYMIDYAEVSAARSLMNIDAKLEDDSGVQKVGIAERMGTIEQRFEFKPDSVQEVNDIYDLTAKELVGGAAQQLNIVFKRQQRYMEEPERTVRAIVGRYRDYAKSAQHEASFLGMLRNEVVGSGAHSFARADSISSVSVWRDEASVSRPLVHILRSRDSNALIHAEEGGEPLEADGLGKYALSDKNTLQRLETMVKGLRVRELIDELNLSLTEEKKRLDFWVQVLQESRNHNLARGVAYDTLVDLGIIERL